MAKSNGCVWVVEWARPRNGTGAAKPLTWRFSAAFDKKIKATAAARDASHWSDKAYHSEANIYRVVKYVPAAK